MRADGGKQKIIRPKGRAWLRKLELYRLQGRISNVIAGDAQALTVQTMENLSIQVLTTIHSQGEQ